MVRKPLTDVFSRRTVYVTVFLFLAFGLLLFKLAMIQVVQGVEYRQLAEDQHSFFKKLVANRGEIKIVDQATGETQAVATNIKKYIVYAVPEQVQNPYEVSARLSPLLGLPAEEIMPKLGWTDKKYVPLKRGLSEDEQQAIADLKLSGIGIDSEDVRFYPEKNLLSQTIGFVGFKEDKKVGLYGLERYFENSLAGTNGFLNQEKGSAGAWIFGAKREITPAEDGVNLILTVDKSIQYKAQSVIKKTVEDNQADSGSIVVADPSTGAVLAVANYPDFDPNEYNKVEDPKTYLNDAMVGNYEPGSIFKPLTMAAAINEGKVTPDTTYTDPGQIEIDGYTIKNSDNEAHGEQTMTQVLEQSLNTGVIYAKEQIGNKTFFDYIKKFGFGEETGIELSEGKGNLDNLKADIKVNFHTASFGQGISVTPIQMIQAFTALANNGAMMRPYIVQSVVRADGSVQKTEPHKVRDVISAKTASTVGAMLVSVVENGHGKKAAVPGYYIAGKTGTAQVPRKDGKPGYDPDNNIGSFIGYGPVENPRFVMIVRVNHPRTVKFAETTAAPAFGEMAAFILNYYHIPPSRK